MSKHTPGPWTFSKSDVYGDLRFYVSQADAAQYTPNYSDVATLIAETVSGERKDIQEANAKLIAAAPELLTALLQIIEDAGPRMGFAEADGAVFGTINRMAYCARQAIAKATGGSGI